MAGICCPLCGYRICDIDERCIKGIDVWCARCGARISIELAFNQRPRPGPKEFKERENRKDGEVDGV